MREFSPNFLLALTVSIEGEERRGALMFQAVLGHTHWSKVEASAFERFINNSALSALESLCAQQNQMPLVKSGLVFGLPPGQEPSKLQSLPDGSSAYVKYCGKFQTILELPVPDEVRKEVYFRVRWYNRLLVSPDPKCSGEQLIKATGSQSDFDSQQPYILASNVEHDVFFASVPGSIAMSQPWLWVMHYESSATVMPDVLLSDDGKPVEIQ
ncbi:TPA: hypothetical protein ACH3X1_009211 [Trebouxia sp. C0004]